MEERTVTVIIPTYKPDEKFRELMKRLAKQTVRPEQILVINTEEAYFHPEDTAGMSNVSVIHIKKDEFDHGGTRDMAARLADTDLLVFMTMDAIPADGYLLENLIRPFLHPKVAASYARQLPGKDGSILEAYTRSFNYGPESCIKTKADLDRLGIKTFFCSNVCAAYRRSTYLELGGFEKHTIFNEDMIFAGKLIQDGKAVAYCADARVYHSHNYTGIQQLKRNFDLGVSQADHPEIFEMAKSETEGIRMVKQTAARLAGTGRRLLLWRFIWQSFCKWSGYRLGKSYRKLPRRFILRCTMNPAYWRQKLPECSRK